MSVEQSNRIKELRHGPTMRLLPHWIAVCENSRTTSGDIVSFYNESDPKNSPLKMKTDYLQVYNVEAINEANEIKPLPLTNLSLYSVSQINKTVCHEKLCCDFSVNFTTLYVIDLEYHKPSNGDEFGAHKYSFAAFSGVRSYGNKYATGGIQVCSIISCLGSSGSDSCGKRTDDISPESVTYFSNYKYIKAFTYFTYISIVAKFDNSVNNSFVTSNILESSSKVYSSDPISKRRFGNILDPSFYKITKNNKTEYTFVNTGVIQNPAAVSLYNRIFDWDSREPTRVNRGCSFNKMSFILPFISVIIILINYF